MREIIFRGKEKDTPYGPLWRYGDLTHNFNSVLINGHVVDPETVGQFTGMKDSTGKEIYEGDIVKATLKDKSFVKRFHMDGTVTGKISFDGAWWLGEWNALWRLPRYYDLTVIGNVHDNPELIKK